MSNDIIFPLNVWNIIFKHFSAKELFDFDSTINKNIHDIILRRRMKCSIIVDDYTTISELFDLIYNSYEMKYVILKTNTETRTYYPCKTMWYSRCENAPLRDYDPDIECSGYSSCYENETSYLALQLSIQEYKEWLELSKNDHHGFNDFNKFLKMEKK